MNCQMLLMGSAILQYPKCMLLNVDDTVLVSPLSIRLQHMINNLGKYYKVWNLKVNFKKLKTMVSREGDKLSTSDKWSYSGEQVEGVNKYKYLGVTFTPNLLWELYL